MRALGQNPTQKEIEEIMKKADVDGECYGHWLFVMRIISPSSGHFVVRYTSTVSIRRN